MFCISQGEVSHVSGDEAMHSIVILSDPGVDRDELRAAPLPLLKASNANNGRCHQTEPQRRLVANMSEPLLRSAMLHNLQVSWGTLRVIMRVRGNLSGIHARLLAARPHIPILTSRDSALHFTRLAYTSIHQDEFIHCIWSILCVENNCFIRT